MIVLGIDQSLTNTAMIALVGGVPPLTHTFKPKETNTIRRLQWLRDQVLAKIGSPDLVVMEDYALVMTQASRQAVLGELGGVLRLALFEYRNQGRGLRFLLVNPSQLKKFVTGSGIAKKEVVIKEVFKRWKFDENDNNLVDAFALAKIGQAYLDDSFAETTFQKDVMKVLRAKGLAFDHSAVKRTPITAEVKRTPV